MDFTTEKITQLYKALLQQGFSFFTFKEYLENKTPSKYIILRHDVEQKYAIALKFAQIQHSLGIKGTYYFRILPECFKPEVVRKIAELGHEVGYHYDDLAQCKGDYGKAIARFEKNLNTLRSIAPVATICMDGSPLSKYDNKDLWNVTPSPSLSLPQSPPPSLPPSPPRPYHAYNLLGEPYFDLDFNKVFYLTDTGRRWDGWKVSVRDKVPQQEQWIKQGLVFHTTEDIIKAATKGQLPDKIMFTFHPQRWNDCFLPWMKELFLQRVKNVVKRVLLKMRNGDGETG